MKNNWYVITGSSSSGKTTLVQVLEGRGYPVVYESARIYIDREISKGRTIQEIRKDEKKFQEKVLELKIQIETDKTLSPEKTIFFDRGIPDTVAYYKLYSYYFDDILKKALKKCSYKKVFLLDQLPYEADYARTESKEQQDLLHGYLKGAYEDLGFAVVKVPVLPIDDRAEFVLTNL